MTVLTVLTFPDDRLRTVAQPITEFKPELQTLIDNMFETMYDQQGIGLAATQVDQHIRLIVVDVNEENTQPTVLINPEIIEHNGENAIEEGCLSLPDARALVSRYDTLTVKYLDRLGKPCTLVASDLLAICIQHEIDHLDGKLFIDHISPLKRQRIQQKLEKLKRQQVTADRDYV